LSSNNPIGGLTYDTAQFYNSALAILAGCGVATLSLHLLPPLSPAFRTRRPPNAQSNQEGLATVNPIFTWVRLAQRVPVHIRVDAIPDGVQLVAGVTATIQIDPR
jgi:hypothetical protein